MIWRAAGWAAVRLSVLLLAALVLAGCSSPSPEPEAGDQPSVITDPTMGLNQTGAHIHDYWHGSDRLVIIGDGAEGDESGLGPGFATGNDIEVRTFKPSSGHVVPQGTAGVEVTFTWTDAADGLDSYGEVSLWVKTAGTNASERIGATGNGQTIAIETGEPDADLPHQLLSAWAFELRMSTPADGTHLRFKGEVAVKVEALRGLPLPVFPAHPDHWKGASEIPLVEASGTLSYWEDTGDGGSNGMSGPVTCTPASGAIVPSNSSHVAVEVTWDGAIALELWYHSATSRDLAMVEPTSEGQGTATYELPIGDGPDGPYAKQSQWEFTVKPAANGPLRTTWFEGYTLTAKAVKG